MIQDLIVVEDAGTVKKSREEEESEKKEFERKFLQHIK